MSRWRPYLSGEPQGSVIAPLLLHIFAINDLHATLGGSACLFADNVKMVKRGLTASLRLWAFEPYKPAAAVYYFMDQEQTKICPHIPQRMHM